MAKEFLGMGWKFPVSLDERGRFSLSAHEEKIEESILVILKTSLGERVMEPEFGCGIDAYLFSTLNMENLALMEEEVKKALLFHEPRIDVDRVKAVPDPEGAAFVSISIDYTVCSTNERRNLVYPFYLNEGG